MTNLFARGKEPFWQQASTNLIKFVILLHQVLDGYVTLFQVYEHVIDPDKRRARMAEGRRRFGVDAREIVVTKQTHLQTASLTPWDWHVDANGTDTWTAWSAKLQAVLESERLEWRIRQSEASAADADKRAQFEAVQRWFDGDWTRIEPKLRTSIVEGVSVFLSLFDDNPRVKHTFCPPKLLYAARATTDPCAWRRPPPIGELIEQGKVIALNFPAAMNPALARALGTMLKRDFQRAALNRIPAMSAAPDRRWRPALFLCDEYRAFATSRRKRAVRRRKSSSRSRVRRGAFRSSRPRASKPTPGTLPGESWRTLLQGLRTKIFLDAVGRLARASQRISAGALNA